jgi:hypothetical protein
VVAEKRWHIKMRKVMKISDPSWKEMYCDGIQKKELENLREVWRSRRLER